MSIRNMSEQRGFSLVELLVAMTVTLIVSAAIYGLLSSGSSAFRREPEIADRQQNIRVAMDAISRDVFNAAAALPPFAQAFTVQDPAGGACSGGLNGCGPAGSLGAAPAAARGGGDPSTDTDVLEMVSVAENCPLATVCNVGPVAGASGQFVVAEPLASCLLDRGLVVLANSTGDPLADDFVVQTAAPVTSAPSACDLGSGGGDSSVNGNVALGLPVAPWTPRNAFSNNNSMFMYAARIVRYSIGPSTDPTDDAPALWRSETGRYGSDGSPRLEPGEAGFPSPGSPWQLVARGIEDLQVEYRGGDGVWRNQPPDITLNDWSGLVREVRITLSALATAPNLQGQVTAGGTGPDAPRGQLTTVVAPRATLNELQIASQMQ
jgi:prepilin-type N-terminal cleavage/methylation domain-containing protein